MIKIIGMVPLHYGKTYLANAVEAVAPFVSKVYILYAIKPSFGFQTSELCPETEGELQDCVSRFGSLVEWHRGTWRNEGEHRNTIHRIAPDAKLILPVDSDEVWEHDALKSCIDQALSGTAARYLIQNWFHLWKDFDHCCIDPWCPVRILKPSGSGDATITGKMFHCAWIQPSNMVRWKMLVHGHRAELRPRWFEDIYCDPNRVTDLHPVVFNWWNRQPFDKTQLPQSLRDHPFYNLKEIP